MPNNIIGIIYKITNRLTGKAYIGQTTGNLDKYWGSGKYIIAAIKKHGKESFTKEVLKECKTENEMNEQEIFFIEKFNTKVPNGYNITIGGNGTRGLQPWNKNLNKETDARVRKMGENVSKAMIKSGCCAGKNNGMFGRKGETHPWFGKHHSKETIDFLKKSYTGEGNPFYKKKHKPESLKKISEASRRKHSEESKKKTSAEMLGRIWINNTKLRSIKRVKKSELNVFLERGYTLGRPTKDIIKLWQTI